MFRIFNDYTLLENVFWRDPKTGKYIVARKGESYDGATGAIDILGDVKAERAGQVVNVSKSWVLHDVVCRTGRWSDGSKISEYDKARILGVALRQEGRWIRGIFWPIATFLYRVTIGRFEK